MFKTVLLAALAVLICQALNSKEFAMAKSFELSQYQWKNRLLFLFGPARSDPLVMGLASQIQSKQAEVADRDLVVFEILESGPSHMNETLLDTAAAEYLRQHFDVPGGSFTIILVGKDGGVKLKRHHEIDLKDIFALIDSMPMRQNEMLQKNDR